MLDVGGLVPLSTTDFPGRLSAVVFLQGCPWRCRYCHNPELQARAAAGDLAWSAVLDFLDRRVGLLDAVVFSGGEPTLQPGLARAVEEVRRRGFAAGLHTAGIYPRRLAQALPRLDWVGLDIKAGFGAYERVIGRRAGASAARASLELLVASGVPHEVRTTWHPDLLGAADLLHMARDLARRGVRHFALQVIAPAPPQADVLACLRALFEAFTLRNSAAAAWGAR